MVTVVCVGSTGLQDGINPAQGVFIEMFVTSYLVLAVLMLAVEKHHATPFAPVSLCRRGTAPSATDDVSLERRRSGSGLLSLSANCTSFHAYRTLSGIDLSFLVGQYTTLAVP